MSEPLVHSPALSSAEGPPRRYRSVRPQPRARRLRRRLHRRHQGAPVARGRAEGAASCSSTCCIAARAGARRTPATAPASSFRCRTSSCARSRRGRTLRCLPPVSTGPAWCSCHGWPRSASRPRRSSSAWRGKKGSTCSGGESCRRPPRASATPRSRPSRSSSRSSSVPAGRPGPEPGATASDRGDRMREVRRRSRESCT